MRRKPDFGNCRSATTSMKRSLWLHFCLTLYSWLIESIPLGNWNRQGDEKLLVNLWSGHGIAFGEIAMLLFVAVPSVLVFSAYVRHKIWLAMLALAFDTAWLGMQIQSWWIPYVFGTTTQWQIEYAKGPTTRILPSFGNHIAPDGMHFVISILLVTAMVSGVVAICRQMTDR